MKTAKEARQELEANEKYQAVITRAKRQLEKSINEAVARGDSRCYAHGWYDATLGLCADDREPINIQDEMVEWVRGLGYSIIWNDKTARPSVKFVCW